MPPSKNDNKFKSQFGMLVVVQSNQHMEERRGKACNSGILQTEK
jgi:hypothetical protein